MFKITTAGNVSFDLMFYEHFCEKQYSNQKRKGMRTLRNPIYKPNSLFLAKAEQDYIVQCKQYQIILLRHFIRSSFSIDFCTITP